MLREYAVVLFPRSAQVPEASTEGYAWGVGYHCAAEGGGVWSLSEQVLGGLCPIIHSAPKIEFRRIRSIETK